MALVLASEPQRQQAGQGDRQPPYDELMFLLGP
jgi:hypothetical protein